jgi:hypothetical protein
MTTAGGTVAEIEFTTSNAPTSAAAKKSPKSHEALPIR